jgi:LEA14-like dessication related protein
MEISKQLNLRARSQAFARLLFLLLVAAGATSCGSQIIKGRPPFINISGISLVEDKLSADFDIRNQNGVPMTIDMIDITVKVNDAELTRENRDFDLSIGANSTEEIHVEELPDDFTRSLLDSLGSGEVKSLAFDLKGKVHTLEDNYLSFAHKGYLYPVPGKPGYFRSAATQTEGLRREEQF